MKQVSAIIFLLVLTVSGQVYTEDSLIFSEDFDGDLSEWIIEQKTGGALAVTGGLLDIDDGGGTTAWYRKILSDSISISYKARCLDDKNNITDLNCFWMSLDRDSNPELSKDSADFFSSGRTGSWPDYHSLRTYYFGYGANLNETFRFRRYYDPDNLPSEVLAMDRDDHRVILDNVDDDESFQNAESEFITPGEWYHFKIVYFKGLVEIYVNGRKAFTYTEQSYDNPYNEGYFGFRTTYSVHAQLDSVRIYRLKTADSKIEDAEVKKNDELSVSVSPNPFNPSTEIILNTGNNYGVRTKGKIEIYSLSGKLVRTLRVNDIVMGQINKRWNGRDHFGRPVGSGVYVFSVNINDRLYSKKMVLQR